MASEMLYNGRRPSHDVASTTHRRHHNNIGEKSVGDSLTTATFLEHH